jgi:signal transduction histidine kinase
MRTQPPLRAIGLNLGLRLYLLLLALFLPAFLFYYAHNVRTLEALHEQEVNDLIRMVSVRIEQEVGDLIEIAWNREKARAAARGQSPAGEPRPVLEGLPEPERSALARHLRGMIAEPNGIESVTVFALDPSGSLLPLASSGAAAPTKQVAEDLDAVAHGRVYKIEVLRGKTLSQAASVPLHEGSEIRGAIHLEVVPDRIGLGFRAREIRQSLILGAVGMVLATGLGVALFFYLTVRRPVRQLTEAMERAAEGNLSALVDIRSGELGWVATSYNQMMRRMKSSMDENRALIVQAKKFNEELRAKIEAATRELAAKNSQLEAANEKLFLLQRQLTTLEKLATLGQIATLIAHELGTPLNAISGHLQLLLSDSVTDPAVLDRLKVIDGQVDRLTNIVRDVLKAMRVPPPKFSSVDVKRVIRDAVELFAPVADKRDISLHLRLEGDLPRIRADAEQLQQVFMNLFNNAMDAMRAGGTLTLSSEFVNEPEAARRLGEAGLAGSPGDCIQIDVTDTGEGMDEETARNAFEPFYTTKGSDTELGRTSTSVGLGLSICRQIVKNHSGEIDVKSAPGKGTRFTLFLPVNPS